VFRSSRGFLSLFALIVIASCSGMSGGSQGEADAATAVVTPSEWAFRPERVIATYADGGMLSTTDRVASEVGAEVLRRGGNAVDAAVAVHFALAVVTPEAGNIGGGGFMIVRMADGESAALDFREKAPLAATRDMFLDDQGRLTDRSQVGHLAAGVPGSVAGMWEAHARFGSLPWAELIEPSVHLADGIVVHERLARSLAAHDATLQRFPATASVFLPNGQAPRVGDRFIQKDLAATLRRISSDGKDGFYRGRTAELIEAEMQRGGGVITREDLGRYATVWRDPIVFQYRDHTVVSMPPPSSGGIAIAELLNILKGYELRELGFLTTEHAHVWAEAAKRAFVDRNTYLADPDFISQPVDVLISDAYAAMRRQDIDIDRATPFEEVLPGLPSETSGAAPREGGDTTHYSIVDGSGNAVAVTTTLNSLYGSGVTVAGAGFLLNNEMDDFAASPGTANQFGLVQGEGNAIEPEKRMLSSMSPTVVLDAAGRVKLVTGSPGGPTIISSVAQMISNVVDFDMDVASATAAPRLHHQHVPDVLSYERDGLTSEVESALRGLGHNVESLVGYQGDTQSILVLPDGTRTGVADPRRGGAALGVRQTIEVVQ
jgi:gamma-glutamyltranspeptidase/glutathione hydrolase